MNRGPHHPTRENRPAAALSTAISFKALKGFRSPMTPLYEGWTGRICFRYLRVELERRAFASEFSVMMSTELMIGLHKWNSRENEISLTTEV